MARGRAYGVVAPVLHRAAVAMGLHRRSLRAPIVVRRVVLDAGLGVRIVLAADLHAHPEFFPRARVREVVDAIRSVDDVDLVAMPGDFVGHDVAAIDVVADELGRIDVPVVATLGNHDHMEGAQRVASALVAAGVDVPTGRVVPVGDRDDLVVVGVDSVIVGVPAAGAIDALVPTGCEAIVLGHEPVLATMHGQRLHLAGHTHHGQVRIPGVPFRYLPSGSRPYPEGLATVDGPTGRRFIYTTGGLGSTTIPVRIGVPPEIVVIDA